MKPAQITDSSERNRAAGRARSPEPAKAEEVAAPQSSAAALLGLQKHAGNAAVSRLIARTPTATHRRPKAFGEGVAEMLASEAPVLLGLVPSDQIEAMQSHLDAIANNEVVTHERHMLDEDIVHRGYTDPQFTADVVDPKAVARIERGTMEVNDAPTKFTLDAQSVLDVAGIQTPHSKSNSLERTFRERIFTELTEGPVIAEIAPMRWGARRGQIGVTYYSSDNYILDHTHGIIHFDDLTTGSGRYAKEYEAQVVDNPEVVQLDKALEALRSQIHAIKKEHLERSDLNKEHGIVRHVSESFGGAGMWDYIELLRDVEANPDKGTLEERLLQLENPYPSIKIWDLPEAQLAEAVALMANGDVDLGMTAFLRATHAATAAAERYQAYEDKVMKGAGIAVKWLGRLKTAGKLAAGVATGGMALEAQAAVAAGYALLQEGAQQEMEVHEGLRDSVDVGGLVKLAATEGAMAYFGGLTQGAFTTTLTARFGERLTASYGEAIAKRMIGTTAAASSQFYNVPANVVLGRIISGEPMPKSMEELADKIADEALKSVAMDQGFAALHAAGGHDPAGGKEAKGGDDKPAPGEGAGVGPDAKAPGEPGPGEPGAGQGAVAGPQSMGPQAMGTGGAKPAGQPHIVEVAAQAHTSPQAREQLLDHFGSWEDAIRGLKEGSGEMGMVAPEARQELIRHLVEHRRSIVTDIGSKFGVKEAPGASAEPGSDIDLNMTGDEAGAHAAEAMSLLDSQHPGWRRRYRMDVLVDAARAETLSKALASLPPHVREGIARRQTMATEAFLLARQARNAATPAERDALLGRIADPELRKRGEWLAGLDAETAKSEQLKLLAHSDRANAAIDPHGTSSDRAAQIGEALDTQALANALDPEAYISTGAIESVVLGKPVDARGRYEAVIEQVDMLAHQAHEAGGMRPALRKYETFKYIQRICDQLTAAGVKDNRIGFLRNEGELVYKLDRNAVFSGDQRTVSPADATGKSSAGYREYGEVPGVSSEFLVEVHGMLQGLINDHLPALRHQALGPGVSAGDPLPIQLPELGPEPPRVADTPPQGQPPGPGPGGAQEAAPAETGLTDPNAVVRVADALVKNRAPGPTTTLQAHADTILAPIAGELARIGTKPPTLKVIDLGKPESWGHFDPVQNLIVVNEKAALPDGRPAFDLNDAAGRQRLQNLVFHESRHAEQYFHAIRYIDGETGGMGIPVLGIHPDILAAAAGKPVEKGSAEWEIGRKSYDEFYGALNPNMQFGQNSERTHQLREQIEQTQVAQDMAQAELESVRWSDIVKRFPAQDKLWGLQKTLVSLKAELDARTKMYWSLFHEQDAYAAGAALDRELPKARLREAERQLRESHEMVESVKTLSPGSEAEALAAAEAAMRVYFDALAAVGETIRDNGKSPAGAPGGAPAAGAKKP